MPNSEFQPFIVAVARKGKRVCVKKKFVNPDGYVDTATCWEKYSEWVRVCLEDFGFVPEIGEKVYE